MPTTAVTRRYFEAISAHDLDTASACWVPGGVDRFVGAQELIAPDGVREYFAALYDAFPDFAIEILKMTTYRRRTAVRWRARATFAGPGTFQGFTANGARIQIEGCDVLTVADDLIEHNEAYIDSGDIARQLGFLPRAGSPAEARLAKLANLRTSVRRAIQGSEPRLIADGVWVVRGGFPLRAMNVYLIQGDGGLTMYDGGISDMASAVRIAVARLGGVKRIVLGHVAADHRGAAPGIDAPVFCHPAVDPQTGMKRAAGVPHPAFNLDTEQARASIRKLASLEPSIAWAGHADPIGGDVGPQLERAAAAPA